MTLIAYDLLRKFIGEQAMVGGPFDSADTFFGAMQDLLNDPKARKAISEAWARRWIEQGLESGESGPLDEIFAALKESSEQALRVQTRQDTHGITSDPQAVKIIDTYLNDVDSCIGSLKFETFCEPHLHYMQALVERAIQVVASTLRVLPLDIIDKLPAAGRERLQELAARIPTIGDPLSAEELWEAVSEIFPQLSKTLDPVGTD